MGVRQDVEAGAKKIREISHEFRETEERWPVSARQVRGTSMSERCSIPFSSRYKIPHDVSGITLILSTSPPTEHSVTVVAVKGFKGGGSFSCRNDDDAGIVRRAVVCVNSKRTGGAPPRSGTTNQLLQAVLLPPL